MTWHGETIVDISRDFLNTNGASQQQEAIVTAPTDRSYFRRGSSSADNFKEQMARSRIRFKYCFSTRPS